jgi:hypothetical protein
MRLMGARTRLRWGATALLALACAWTARSEEPSFDVLRAEAKANAATPAGRAYETTLGREFNRRYGPETAACAGSLKAPDYGPFDVLLRLSAKGAVEAVRVHPETNLAVCLRQKLAHGSLPAPPKAGYWVHVGVAIRR